MEWSLFKILYVFFLFLVAGLAEIGGGWLIWENMRNNKPYYFALSGAIILVVYGYIPTFQPINDFGRLYAIYGGIFIGLSFVWGYYMDGFILDKGDILGSLIAFIGVLIILFWPRNMNNEPENQAAIELNEYLITK